MTDKALVIDALHKLPDNSTLGDIREQVEFMAAVREGLEQIQRGQVVSLDEIESKIETWASG